MSFTEKCVCCGLEFDEENLHTIYIESLICTNCRNTKSVSEVVLAVAKEVKPVDLEDIEETVRSQLQ